MLDDAIIFGLMGGAPPAPGHYRSMLYIFRKVPSS